MPFKSLYHRKTLAESVFMSPSRKAAAQRAEDAVKRIKQVHGDAGVRALARAASSATMVATDEHSRPHQQGADAVHSDEE